jgi:hypothetical protein
MTPARRTHIHSPEVRAQVAREYACPRMRAVVTLTLEEGKPFGCSHVTACGIQNVNDGAVLWEGCARPEGRDLAPVEAREFLVMRGLRWRDLGGPVTKKRRGKPWPPAPVPFTTPRRPWLEHGR